MKFYYLGVDYDELSNGISARIIQDVMACKNVADAYHRELIICSPKADAIKGLLKTLFVEVTSENLKAPSIYLVYKSGDNYPQVPYCTQVQRNLQVRKKDPHILNLEPSLGPQLHEDSRISYSNTNRMYNHPNGFAPPDAAMIMLWGPVKA